MIRRLKFLYCAIGLMCLGLAVLAGCGSGSSNQAQLRVMNASPGESNVDALVDGKTIASNIAYGTSSSYQGVSTGNREVQIEDSATLTAIVNTSLTASANTNYTLLLANYSNAVTPVWFTDDISAPSSGQVKVRVINAAPALGTADVYIVASGTDITTVSATVSGLVFEAGSAYQSLGAGTYEVFWTLPGQKFALIDSGAIQLSAGQVRTVVSLNSTAGGFTSTVLNDRN